MNERDLLRQLDTKDAAIVRLQSALAEILNRLEPAIGDYQTDRESVSAAVLAADAALADTRDAGRDADDALAHVA